MKKFFCLLALCLTTPLVFAMDVEFGGQHRARGIYYQQDMSDIFIQRFKFSGAFRPNEMFESHFSVMTNYNWGDTEYSDNDIRIYGHGDWKVSDELMIRLGRAAYQIADGSSVGMNDYEKYPYAMDGAFLTYNTESLAVDLWGAYLPKVWNGSVEAEQYKRAVGASLDVRSLPEEFKMANLHIIYVDKGDSDQVRVGLGIGGDISGLDYKLTGAVHGDGEDALGNLLDNYAVDGQLGYTLDFDARIYIGGHYESEVAEGSAGYDPFYYNRHGRSGLLDVAQWGGGTVYGEAGISYMPSEDFEIGIMGLYFDNIGSWGQWGNGGQHPEQETGENAQETAKKNALSTTEVIEADLYVKKSYAGGFSIKLQGGLFDLAADKAYWQVQLNTTFDF